MQWSLKRDAIALSAIVATFAVTLYFLPSLPEQVPTHFGMDGTADGFSSKDWLLAMNVGLPVLLYLTLTFLPFIDPFWKKIREKYHVLLLFRDIVMVFMLYLLTTTLLSARSGSLRNDFLGVGFGLLFIVLGNYLPRLPRNFFFGIRTPWTLASEVVWKRTHIVSGWLFVAGGCLMVVLALAGVSQEVSFLGVMLPMFIISSVVYPLLLYRKLQKENQIHQPNL